VLGDIHPDVRLQLWRLERGHERSLPGRQLDHDHHQAQPQPFARTTTTTVPPAKVPVVVANASGVTGAAAAISAELTAGGWNLLAAGQRTTASWPLRPRLLSRRLPAGGRVHRHVAPSAGHRGGPVHHGGTDQLHRHGQVVVVAGPDLATRPPATTTTTAR
jgi:hypothetical protein